LWRDNAREMAHLRTDSLPELECRLSQTNSLIKICQAQVEVSKISQANAVRPEDRQTIAQAIERLEEDLQKNKTTRQALQEEIARRNAITAENEELLVPPEPAQDANRQPNINANELSCLFNDKSESLRTRLTLLLQYATTHSLDHAMIRLALNWVLSPEEKVYYRLVQDKELQACITALLSMYREPNKTRSYYENLLNNFKRPVGEDIRATMSRFQAICHKLVQQAPPNSGVGLNLRYCELAVFHLCTPETVKEIKKWMKSHEMNNAYHTPTTLIAEASKIEQLENSQPTHEMSMSHVDIKIHLLQTGKEKDPFAQQN